MAVKKKTHKEKDTITYNLYHNNGYILKTQFSNHHTNKKDNIITFTNVSIWLQNEWPVNLEKITIEVHKNHASITIETQKNTYYTRTTCEYKKKNRTKLTPETLYDIFLRVRELIYENEYIKYNNWPYSPEIILFGNNTFLLAYEKLIPPYTDNHKYYDISYLMTFTSMRVSKEGHWIFQECLDCNRNDNDTSKYADAYIITTPYNDKRDIIEKPDNQFFKVATIPDKLTELPQLFIQSVRHYNTYDGQLMELKDGHFVPSNKEPIRPSWCFYTRHQQQNEKIKNIKPLDNIYPDVVTKTDAEFFSNFDTLTSTYSTSTLNLS